MNKNKITRATTKLISHTAYSLKIIAAIISQQINNNSLILVQYRAIQFSQKTNKITDKYLH